MLFWIYITLDLPGEQLRILLILYLLLFLKYCKLELLFDLHSRNYHWTCRRWWQLSVQRSKLMPCPHHKWSSCSFPWVWGLYHWVWNNISAFFKLMNFHGQKRRGILHIFRFVIWIKGWSESFREKFPMKFIRWKLLLLEQTQVDHHFITISQSTL